MNKKHFYEMELKALLTEEKYNKLLERMKKELELADEDIIFTTKYTPGDVRVRHSKKINEIVCKTGDPTSISRKEITVKLESAEQAERAKQMLEMLGFKADPSWENNKHEFKYKHNGQEYSLCLQHIKNFAYILEAEIISGKDESTEHRSALRKILESYGCEPINPEDFKDRIQEYVKKNKRVV